MVNSFWPLVYYPNVHAFPQYSSHHINVDQPTHSLTGSFTNHWIFKGGQVELPHHTAGGLPLPSMCSQHVVYRVLRLASVVAGSEVVEHPNGVQL